MEDPHERASCPNKGMFRSAQHDGKRDSASQWWEKKKKDKKKKQQTTPPHN